MKADEEIFNNSSFEPKNMKMISVFLILMFGFLCVSLVSAQTSVFTYQGKLNDGGVPANGNYDLRFRLFDAASAGNQIGTTQTITNVAATDGSFTVQLNFGAASFSGADRWIEINVSPTGQNNFTTLQPRQPLTSAPYSIRALSAAADTATNAANATNATNAANADTLDSMDSSSFVQTATTAFIRNQTTPQTVLSFNIDGTGRANIISAATQYNIGSQRILSSAGTNMFAGILAGLNNTGNNNLFVGVQAGFSNTTGSGNSFVGTNAGLGNTTGINNSFFGTGAGASNTIGSHNSFFGTSVGVNNTEGNFNSFFGRSAGVGNTTGSGNAFFGAEAGQTNTTGYDNSFFGKGAGQLNSTGFFNSFFGKEAGKSTSTGNGNSFFGFNAGFNNTTGNANSFFGSSAGNGTTTGSLNAFVGTNAGRLNTTGEGNSLFGALTGENMTTGGGNSFFGATTGQTNTTGFNNTLIGAGADVAFDSFNFATAVGAGATALQSNSITLGRSDGSDTVYLPGSGAAGVNHLCRNNNSQISSCSSSLRYKTNIATFPFGLNLINQLRPISFDWKNGGMADVGFGAEDVARINPLFVTYNKAGDVEGVKYDRLSVAFVNAFKEQQAQIERLQEQNKQQGILIDGLRELVCQTNPQAAVCQEKK